MVLTGLLEEHGLGSEWWITAAHMTGAKSEGGNKYEPWSSNMGDFCDCKVCVCVFVFLTGHGDVENLPLLSVCMALSEMTGAQSFTSFFLLVSGDA